jgi:hypothetical protein
MSRNDKISLILGILFLVLFAYFLYIKYYLYAIGWLILGIALFLGAYTPRDTSSREVLVLIDVILPFIALGIFIYAIIYG